MTYMLRVITFAALLPAMAASFGCAGEPQRGDNANRAAQQEPAAAPAATVATPGGLEITSTPPGARVLLIATGEGASGRPVPRGLTPASLTDVTPGKYTVHLEYPGYRYFQKEVEVKAGETVKVEARLRKE